MAYNQEVLVRTLALNDASYYINMHENNRNKGSQIGQTKKKYFFQKA
jgi:hypothetical protein